MTGIWKKVYSVLASAKLALGLLVAILTCCLVGVTVLRGEKAWTYVFHTLWFNAILVLLVVNVAFCFFPRMWGRRLTVVSFGMILFHLSFVMILLGVIYNSQFYFRGQIRLTEGESLSSDDPGSYDYVDKGRFFNFSILKGETRLIRMHRDYTIDEENKRAAYEIEVGEEGASSRGIVYITNSMKRQGITYLNEKEGYSVLVVLYDKSGAERYGAFLPLQSLKQTDGSYLYTTGSREGPGYVPFPAEPMDPEFMLQVAFRPALMTERDGDVAFKIADIVTDDMHSGGRTGSDDREAGVREHEEFAASDSAIRHGAANGETIWNQAGERMMVNVIAEGEIPLGEEFDAGEYYVVVPEVRYWVAMNVRYEPGNPVVLGSLWASLGGMVITMFGRIRNRRSSVGKLMRV